GLAGWVEQRALDLEAPAGAAVQQIGFLRLQGGASLEHLPVELLVASSALLRKDVDIGLAQDLVAAPPDGLFKPAVDEQIAAVEILHVDGYARVVEDRLQQLLVLAERLFGPLALGDDLNRAEDA